MNFLNAFLICIIVIQIYIIYTKLQICDFPYILLSIPLVLFLEKTESYSTNRITEGGHEKSKTLSSLDRFRLARNTYKHKPIENYSEKEKKYIKFMENYKSQEICKKDTFQRYITPEWQRIPYRRRRNEYKPQLHWGQRKLLLSEIEFLTLYAPADKKWLVVYAGAADGKHDIYLASLFPNCEFHLYDPARFDRNLVEFSKTHDNIKIFNEYFTNEVCEKYKNKNNILFISDIRTVSNKQKNINKNNEFDTSGDEEWDKEIEENMNWQKEWINIIQPEAFMVKFRLSYSPGKTEYYDGKIYFQVWAGSTSTEGRLIAQKPYNMKEYNNEDYEQCMFKLNVCDRANEWNEIPFPYPSPVLNNYDVLAEEHILAEYIKEFKNAPDFPHPKNIFDMKKDIDENLGMELKEKYIKEKIRELSIIMPNI